MNTDELVKQYYNLIQKDKEYFQTYQKADQNTFEGQLKNALSMLYLCERAKEKYKKLRKIEICVIDNMTVNAMALGRNTIAVTKGAMQTFTEDELKAVIGHEIAHLVHGDTMASIYAIVGNGILSVFVLIARLFLLLLDWVQSAFTGKRSIFSALMLLIRLYFEFSIWFLNFGLQVILSVNSRKNEFKADLFSYSIGYDTDMIEA